MCLPRFSRKRLSCSESFFTESDSSPPSGARRRFSALMDMSRFASPQELNAEPPGPGKQPPIKTRGTSLEGAIPSHGDLRTLLKDGRGHMASGKALERLCAIWFHGSALS